MLNSTAVNVNEHFGNLLKRLNLHLKRSTDYSWEKQYSSERLADVEQALTSIDLFMPEPEALPFHPTLQKLRVSLEAIRLKIIENLFA